jgi:hypothetical protein
VPFDPKDAAKFNPNTVPTLAGLISEYDEFKLNNKDKEFNLESKN